MKDFAVAYGMARRAKRLGPSSPIDVTEPDQDMIQAIISKRQAKYDSEQRELGFNNEGDEIGGEDNLDVIEEDPAIDRKAKIAQLLGR